jgi:hypothetical protein
LTNTLPRPLREHLFRPGVRGEAVHCLRAS